MPSRALLSIALLIVVSCLSGPSSGQSLAAAAPEEAARVEQTDDFSQAFLPDRPWETIEMAILLDTSGSMQGLIDAARIKLWDVVNDLTLAQPTPRLRVALVTFGHSKSPRATGYVKVETDLTEDLDLVSERLFALTSAGGTEYVGRVLKIALEDLTWTDSHDTLKLVFLAGNEPADQDREVDFRNMSEEAWQRGIEVNSVFCGNGENEQADTWKEIAELARSQFATINHRRGPLMVETPFDAELTELGDAINKTYMPFGETGASRRDVQISQDKNARKVSAAVAASRAQAKSSPLYAPDWDLVRALEDESISLYDLEAGDLPKELRSLSYEELAIRVEQMRLERDELRQQIAELGRKRSQFIAQQAEAKGLDDSWAFDSVLRRVIREKAEEKGFEFPE
jgi:hypothetical protein